MSHSLIGTYQHIYVKGANIENTASRYPLAKINVLAQGHNTVTTVRIEPAAPRSRVEHSTTEPLHSLSRPVFKKIDLSLHCVYEQG